jgi:hypothetical protein
MCLEELHLSVIVIVNEGGKFDQTIMNRVVPTSDSHCGALSNNSQFALQLFERNALRLRVDEQNYKKLQYHHGREEREGSAAGGLCKDGEDK